MIAEEAACLCEHSMRLSCGCKVDCEGMGVGEDGECLVSDGEDGRRQGREVASVQREYSD